MTNRYVSPPMRLTADGLEVPFEKAEVQVLGLRHGGASFEARIFVNNPDANESTKPTPDNGYVGCFFVFGHGGCFGEPGHCDVRQRRPNDPRPPHPLTPMTKVVAMTRPFKEIVDPAKEFTVTVIARPFAYNPPKDGRNYLPEFNADRENLLQFEELRVVTYD